MSVASVNNELTNISVVIPTCDRKDTLLRLLQDLDRSQYPIAEVIIVDSGNSELNEQEMARHTRFQIRYFKSRKSVCIQRNLGIREARYQWVLLCDDDMGIPPAYLENLVQYIKSHPETGAVSGHWLENRSGKWASGFSLTSASSLVWKYIFHLGIWGPIECESEHFLIRKIKAYYQRRGNHISSAGWPVNTNFARAVSNCPVYSLGSALVRKEWLLRSAFDEVLDTYGIGENYGVCIGFPIPGVQVLNDVPVYHHRAEGNRLKETMQYYRRTLALDYFISTRTELRFVKKTMFLWSLIGNLIGFIIGADSKMVKAGVKVIYQIMFRRNPYVIGRRRHLKVVCPDVGHE